MLFREKHKIGETLPVGELSLDDSIKIITKQCNCARSFIVQLPTAHIEHLPRFYDEFKYVCLNCKWESIKFRTRTQ